MPAGFAEGLRDVRVALNVAGIPTTDGWSLVKGMLKWLHAGKVFEDDTWWYSTKIRGTKDVTPTRIVDCMEYGARLPQILSRVRREMKSFVQTEVDPAPMKMGRYQKVPAEISVLVVWSGNEIKPTGDKSRVEGTRLDDERVAWATCLARVDRSRPKLPRDRPEYSRLRTLTSIDRDVPRNCDVVFPVDGAPMVANGANPRRSWTLGRSPAMQDLGAPGGSGGLVLGWRCRPLQRAGPPWVGLQ